MQTFRESSLEILLETNSEVVAMREIVRLAKESLTKKLSNNISTSKQLSVIDPLLNDVLTMLEVLTKQTL